MHSLAATRGRGTWAGEAAVSAKARVPRPMEYRIGLMFAFIFSYSFDHPCEDAYFDFYFVQPEKNAMRSGDKLVESLGVKLSNSFTRRAS